MRKMVRSIVSPDGKHLMVNPETPLNMVMSPSQCAPVIETVDKPDEKLITEASKGWEAYAENDLEEVLLNNFEFNFQEAAVKGYNEAMDINQSKIMEAVAKVLAARPPKQDGTAKDMSDVKELRKAVLSEMLQRMNKERVQLSTGEAMWRLLMCDVSKAMFHELKAISGQATSSTEVPSSGNAAKGEAEKDVNLGNAATGDAENDVKETSETSVPEPQPEHQTVPKTESETLPDGSETAPELRKRIKQLEEQLQERSEWAQQKVLQATQRLSKDFNELKRLRAEKEEAVRGEESKSKQIADLEFSIRKITTQLDQARAALQSSEGQNAELKAELQAAQLNVAESVASSLEVSKREKKNMKNVQSWEKQKSKLQEELGAEKRRLVELQQQLNQANENLQQAMVRTRQATKAKEEALAKLEQDKMARDEARAAYKRREAALQRKSEEEVRKIRDDMHRLRDEVRELKLGNHTPTTTLSWDSTFTESVLDEWLDPHEQTSETPVLRDRECIMCLTEEKTVVFLPCAHQLVCASCNEVHKKSFNECPSCRVPIQQRINVFGK